MSAYADARAIETRFYAQWVATPILWGNIDPDGAVIDAQQKRLPWARLSVRAGGEATYSLGPTPLYRRLGMIAIDIFTAANTGTHEAKRLADEAAAIFRGRTFAQIICGPANINERDLTGGGGVADRDIAGAWYSLMVSIPYRRDEIFALEDV